MGKGTPLNPRPSDVQSARMLELTILHRGYCQTLDAEKSTWNETKKALDAQIEHIEKQLHRVATDIEAGQTDLFDEEAGKK